MYDEAGVIAQVGTRRPWRTLPAYIPDRSARLHSCWHVRDGVSSRDRPKLWTLMLQPSFQGAVARRQRVFQALPCISQKQLGPPFS